MRGPRDSDAAQAALVVVGFDTLDGDEAEAFIPEPVEVGKEARVRRRSGESSEIFMWVELGGSSGTEERVAALERVEGGGLGKKFYAARDGKVEEEFEF
jgi:hypothetical protein